MELWELEERLLSLDVKEEVKVAMMQTEKKLTSAQKEQMEQGFRSTGKKIGKYKSKKYAEMKYTLNQKAGKGFKDLKLTGDFHRGIIVDIQEEGVVFSSADEKTTSIVEREGEDIFGLTDEVASIYSTEALEPVANRRIMEHLYGK